MISEVPYVFIVGNSRSGTTMLLRMLNIHSKLFVGNEFHFFEQLWSSADKNSMINNSSAEQLLSKLFYIHYEGYTGEMEVEKYAQEAREFVATEGKGLHYAHEYFGKFLLMLTDKANKEIPCEKTPQNIFYIKEILEIFPNSKFIHIVRDPRAILLSQKNKWKRRKMGASFITEREVLRLRINYHPYTLSKLWQSAIKAGLTFEDNPALLTIRFEDLLLQPDITLQQLCTHLQVPYEPQMMDIPLSSSSNEADSTTKGIKKERAETWKHGGLSDTEIAICEHVNKPYLEKYGYTLTAKSGSIFHKVLWMALFPVKTVLALIMNRNRMKNMVETLRKRL